MSLTTNQQLKLLGKTVVFIDYANVYGWRDVLDKAVDPKKLYKYLKKYSEIEKINLYYGKDDNPQSKKFLTEIKSIGYNLITKAVKYIALGNIDGQYLKQRKCDFDIEICMSVYECLDNDFQTYIFFSGDGDFAPIYRYLTKKNKKVIVVYAKKHIGQEIWEIEKGLFKIQVNQLI